MLYHNNGFSPLVSAIMPYAADAFFGIRFNKEAITPITILNK
jgi:hypothetical protein